MCPIDRVLISDIKNIQFVGLELATYSVQSLKKVHFSSGLPIHLKRIMHKYDNLDCLLLVAAGLLGSQGKKSNF